MDVFVARASEVQREIIFRSPQRLAAIHTAALRLIHSFISVIMQKVFSLQHFICLFLELNNKTLVTLYSIVTFVNISYLHFLTLTLKYTDKMFMLFNLLELTNVLVIVNVN